MSSDIKGFRTKKERVKSAYGRRVSSTKWLDRHINDPYVQLAKAKGYRSRAAFKLLEILEKYPHLKRYETIVDLGCAPGGWLQVISTLCKSSQVIGLDLKDVDEVEGVTILQGDFLEEDTHLMLGEVLNGKKVGLIISDMAANSSGDRDLDHMRNAELVEMALEFALLQMEKGGSMICKVLRGREDNRILNMIRQHFSKVSYFKPTSSYSGSSELFLIAINKKE